jgi:hypothetical protein
VDNEWWFAGTTVWRVENRTRTWLWTVEHDHPRRVGGFVLPGQTEIRRPDGTGELVLTIDYERQRPEPADLADGTEPPPDTWDDDWEDEADEPTAGATRPETDPSSSTIPAIFRLDASGLASRGDLCRPE